MTKLLMKPKSCLNKLFRHQYLLQSLPNVTQIQGQTQIQAQTQIQGQTQIQAQIQKQSKAGPIPTRCSYISADYNPCPPPILANCHVQQVQQVQHVRVQLHNIYAKSGAQLYYCCLRK